MAASPRRLRRRLKRLEANRGVQRSERTRAALPTIALAGYTNAGKSTLLNALTGATVPVRDRLFHTLDPTTRVLRADGRDYLLTDTVGFIRKLPHQLVDAFGATLEDANNIFRVEVMQTRLIETQMRSSEQANSGFVGVVELAA